MNNTDSVIEPLSHARRVQSEVSEGSMLRRAPASNASAARSSAERLRKLHEQLADKRRRQQRFERAHEKACTFMRGELTQRRRHYHLSLIEQTEKLIGHFGKKSLVSWQSDDVREWIGQNLAVLETQQVPQVRKLAEDFQEICVSRLSQVERQLVRNELNMTVDELVSAVEHGQFEGLRNTGLIDHVFEPPPSKDNIRYTRSSQPERRSRASGGPDTADDPSVRQRLVDQLFRRAAKVLHPDHESDTMAQEQKQQLMKELLAARKEGNVDVIFDLYRRYVNSTFDGFDVPDMKSLVAILERQIRLLDTRYRQLVNQSPTHQWVEQHMVSKSEADQQQTLNALKTEVETALAEIARVKPYLRNLTQLKVLLSRRRQSSA